MEMNTRLQVEHPVTEMVTGIDLVQWQIRVAAGIELSFSQEDIQLKGHAIECRVNAEDPAHGFRPSCGQIQFLHIPGGPGVRFETAVYPGYFVPPFYDSMIGKLVVHGDTRDQAIRKMKTALGELVIEGISHNAELQMELMGGPEICGWNLHHRARWPSGRRNGRPEQIPGRQPGLFRGGKAWGTKSFESSRKKRRRSVLRSCKAKEPIALAAARIFRGTPSGAAQLKKIPGI